MKDFPCYFKMFSCVWVHIKTNMRFCAYIERSVLNTYRSGVCFEQSCREELNKQFNFNTLLP